MVFISIIPAGFGVRQVQVFPDDASLCLAWFGFPIIYFSSGLSENDREKANHKRQAGSYQDSTIIPWDLYFYLSFPRFLLVFEGIT